MKKGLDLWDPYQSLDSFERETAKAFYYRELIVLAILAIGGLIFIFF